MNSKARKTRRKRIIASALTITVAATAFIGGSLAVFTDRDSGESQRLTAGTLDIALSDDVLNPNFNIPIGPMAAGDRFSRYVNLNNEGNLPVGTLTLEQENGGGLLITGAQGVEVNVSGCSTAWTNGVCTGEEYANVVNSLPLRNWASAITLDMPELQPGSAFFFKFTTHLPDSAGNSYQAESTSARYSFNGIQRGAVAHGSDGTATPVDDPNGDPAAEGASLTVQASGPRTVDLSWPSVLTATNYRVDRTKDPLSTAFQTVSYGLNTSLRDESVNPGTAYYYRIVTFGAKPADRVVGPWLAATTWLDPADIPELSVGLVDGIASLSWGSMAGLDSYELSRAEGLTVNTSPSGRSAKMALAPSSSNGFQEPGPDAYSVIANGSDLLSFSDPNMEPGGLYWYKLGVVNAGPKLYSSPVPLAVPMAKPIVASTTNEQGETVFSWSAVEGAVKYRVVRVSQSSTGAATDTYETGSSTEFTQALPLGKNMTFKVEAISRYGVVTESVSKAISTVLGSSSLDIVTTFSTATVSWRSNASVDSYVLDYATTPSMAGAKIAYSGSATSFTVAGLRANSEYFFRVTATKSGESTASPVLRALTSLAPATAAIEDLTARTATAKVVSPPTSSVSYVVEYKSSNGTVKLPKTRSLSLPLIDLLPSTAYQIRVATVEENVSTVMGPWTDFTTAPGAALLADPVTDRDSVSLTWVKVNGASGYRLERASDQAFTSNVVVLQESNANSFTDESVAHGIQYSYRLTTLLPEGEAASLIKTATLNLPAITAQAFYQSGIVSVAWNQIPSASLYTVRRTAVNSSGVAEEVYRGSDLYFNDTSLILGRSYSYVVTATNSLDQSVSSSVTVGAPLATSTLTGTLTNDEEITLSWTEVPTATGYRLAKSLSPDGPYTTVYEGLGLSFVDANVVANSTYYYNVTSLAPSGGTSSKTPDTQVKAVPGTVELVVSPEIGSTGFAWTGGPYSSVSLVLASDSQMTEDRETVALNAGSPSETLATLTPGRRYYAQLRAVSLNGPLRLSSPQAFIQPLADPVLSLRETSANSAKLEWTADDNLNFQVQVETSPGAWFTVCSTAPGAAKQCQVGQLEPSTTYKFRVKAVYPGTGASSTSASVSAVTKPNTPRLTAARVAQSQAIKLSWVTTPSSSYTVIRSVSPDFSSPSAIYQGSAGTFTDESPIPGAVNYYRVVVTDSYGASQSSEASLTTTLSTPTLTLTSVAKDVTTLSWAPIPGATSYELMANESVVYLGGATSFTHTGLTAGETYTYSLTAISAQDVRSEHAEAIALTLIDGGVVTAGTIGAYDATITWTGGSGASSYRVERGSSANGPWTEIGNTSSGLSFKDMGLQPVTTYWYRVVYIANNGLRVTSDSISVTTNPDRVVLTAIPTSGYRVDLSWQNISSANSYVVYRGLTSSTVTSQVYSGSGNSWADTTVQPGRAYFYKVSALTATNQSAANDSEVVGIITPMAGSPTLTQPTTDAADTGTNRRVSLSWTSVIGASTYRLEYRLSGATAWTSGGSTGSTSLNLVVPQQVTREYRVVALDSLGSTLSGNVVEYTTSTAPLTTLNGGSEPTATAKLTWTQVSYVSNYVIQRKVSNAPDSTVIEVGSAPGSSSSYVDSTVVPSTQYAYRVVSYGLNPKSAPATSAWVIASSGVAAVDVLNVMNVDSETQTISWAPSPGATDYTLRAQLNSGVSKVIASGANLTSYTATDLSAGGTYSYQVTVRSAASANNPGLITSLALPWAAPKLKFSASSTPSTPYVTWTGATNSYSYVVQYSSSPDFASPVTVANSGVNAGEVALYAYNTLAAGNRYYLRILAQNTVSQEFGVSNVLTYVTALATTPKVVTATAPASVPSPTEASLTVTHNTVAGATSYTVELSKSASGSPVVASSPSSPSGANQTVTFTGLSASTLYYIRVSAANTTGSTSQTGWDSSVKTGTAPPELEQPTANRVSHDTFYYRVTNLPTGTPVTVNYSVYKDPGLTTLVASDSVSSNGAGVIERSFVISNSDRGREYYGRATVNSINSNTLPVSSIDARTVLTLQQTNYFQTPAAITISWIPVPGALEYQYVTQTSTVLGAEGVSTLASPMTVAGNITSASFTTSSTTLSVYVRARTADGYLPWAAAVRSSQYTPWKCTVNEIDATTSQLTCAGIPNNGTVRFYWIPKSTLGWPSMNNRVQLNTTNYSNGTYTIPTSLLKAGTNYYTLVTGSSDIGPTFEYTKKY